MATQSGSASFTSTTRATALGGWTGATSTPASVGDSGATNYSCQIITRSTFRPYQRSSSTLTIPVYAAHAEGDDYITGAVDQGGFVAGSRGTNPYTDTAEYYHEAALQMSDYSEGLHEARVKVYPVNGQPRVISGLYFVANPSGTGRYAPVYAYVSTGGNDTSGVASPTAATAAATPCATIGKAADKIAAYRLANFGADDLDHGIIRMVHGQVHAWDGGGSNSPRLSGPAWLTVEPEPGHDASDTTIRNAGVTVLVTNHLYIHDIRLEQTNGENGFYLVGTAASDILWLENNVIVGGGKTLDGSNIYDSNWSAVYLVGNDISNVLEIDFTAAWDNTFHDLNKDVGGAGSVFDVGNDSYDMGPEATGQHSDRWQRFGGGTLDDNVIFAWNTAAMSTDSNGDNGHGMLVFLDTGSDPVDGTRANGMMIVGNTITGTAGVYSNWTRWADHVLLIDNHFAEPTGWFFVQERSINPKITHFKATGNYFYMLGVPSGNDADVDYSQWDNNRFDVIPGDPEATVQTSVMKGTNAVHV